MATTTSNSIAVATGNVNHFTVFGVVELPPPSPPSGDGTADVIVTSEFALDTQGELDVSFLFNKSDLPEIQPGEERLLRFAGMNEKSEYTFTGAMPELVHKCDSLRCSTQLLFPDWNRGHHNHQPERSGIQHYPGWQFCCPVA